MARYADRAGAASSRAFFDANRDPTRAVLRVELASAASPRADALEPRPDQEGSGDRRIVARSGSPARPVTLTSTAWADGVLVAFQVRSADEPMEPAGALAAVAARRSPPRRSGEVRLTPPGRGAAAARRLRHY
jgi:hypothetical protein